jgi:hypothetical protein
MYRQKILVLTSGAILLLTAGCAHKTLHAAAIPNTPVDNSYMDLTAGGSLRITVPILTSGGYQVATNTVHEHGNSIVMSAANLAGYAVSYYSIEGRSKGKVQVRFRAAEITRNGTTVQQTSAPRLPFLLPSASEYIRLIYLVRKSPADHNMAIAASKNLDALNAFTNRLKRQPDVCKPDAVVSCFWVPAGVAVRPE